MTYKTNCYWNDEPAQLFVDYTYPDKIDALTILTEDNQVKNIDFCIGDEAALRALTYVDAVILENELALDFKLNGDD